MDVVDDLDALAAEWRALGERTENLFATWDWQSTWWRHFGRGRRLAVAACRDERANLVGLLPTYIARAAGPVRLFRLVGHGQSDRLGPVCLPGNRHRCIGGLRKALRARPWRGAALVAEQLPAEEGWAAALGGSVVAREASPLLAVTGSSWDEYLAAQSSSLRKQIRYQERRLQREHDVRYRLVTRASELPEALEVVFALHGARWGEKGSQVFTAASAFHADFAAHALEREWLRLWLLEANGRPVAAWYGFRFAGADWHYQSGRDPNWDHYSVGAVLLAHTIRDCIESGLRRYLFLRGGEAYKLRFANGDAPLETALLASGPASRLARVAAAAARHVPPALRRRMRREVLNEAL